MSLEIVVQVTCDCCNEAEALGVEVDFIMIESDLETHPELTPEVLAEYGYETNVERDGMLYEHLCRQCK